MQEWSKGNHQAAERLFQLVYDELKRQARKHLSRERADHTLQPTALVHEAYLKLVDQTVLKAENRAHFYSIAARVMRRILVDHARQHSAEKRGGAAQKLSLDEVNVSLEQHSTDLIALDEALNNLAKFDERKSRVVELLYFGGMENEEAAQVLGVSEKTVRRDWQMAKMWLSRELSLGTT